eukprot:jgi/Phyca11/506803/fgenesh2_kg.PHYCAscaffold_22_\
MLQISHYWQHLQLNIKRENVFCRKHINACSLGLGSSCVSNIGTKTGIYVNVL